MVQKLKKVAGWEVLKAAKLIEGLGGFSRPPNERTSFVLDLIEWTISQEHCHLGSIEGRQTSENPCVPYALALIEDP